MTDFAGADLAPVHEGVFGSMPAVRQLVARGLRTAEREGRLLPVDGMGAAFLAEALGVTTPTCRCGFLLSGGRQTCGGISCRSARIAPAEKPPRAVERSR